MENKFSKLSAKIVKEMKRLRVPGLDEPYKDALGDFFRDQKGRVKYFHIGGRAHKKIA